MPSFMLAQADGGSVPELTIGLGIIAVALVTGQWLFYKYVHTPAIDRAEKALADEVDRGLQVLATTQEANIKALEVERSRADRLEAEVKRQNDVLQEKALPALIAATATVSESQALLRDLRREQELLQMEREREQRVRGA